MWVEIHFVPSSKGFGHFMDMPIKWDGPKIIHLKPFQLIRIPYISDQKYNEYLKELFKDQDINRLVTKLDPKTRKSIQVPIRDIASSHMARRVFIGGLHHKGATNEIIASMSGHVENSKAFARYYNIGKSDQQSAISLIE